MCKTMVWGCVVLSVLCGGCDLGPYPDLQEPIDPFVGLDSREHTTYLFADEDISIFIVFSGADTASRRFTRTVYQLDGSAILLGGTYRFEDDQLFLEAEQLFDREPNGIPFGDRLGGTYRFEDDQLFLEAEQLFDREPNGIPFGDRRGSIRSETSRVLAFTFETGDREITLTDANDVRRRYVNLDRVIERASSYSPELIARLFNAMQVSTQARIVGFGTTAMIEYATPAEFGASIQGTFTVGLDNLLSPTTTIRYDSFSDFSGVQFDGEQFTKTDLSGDGFSYGVVRMTLTTSDGASQTIVDNDYGEEDGSEGLVIVDGEGGGGFYRFTIDGERSEVFWADFENRDISGLLEPFDLESPTGARIGADPL